MAQVVLSAKSGNDWTDNELIGLNVSYQNVDVPTFFGTSQLPVTSVSPVILNNDVEPLPPTVLSKDERLFFRYLHRAVVENEVSVDDWAGHVLRILDYDGGDREIATKRELSFTMCGERKWAKPDFVVLSGGQRTLLVQEDKHVRHVAEPFPQLVADSIAAFTENNFLRAVALPEGMIYGITITGTAPVFYKLPITQTLVQAVVTGQYPAQRTVVQRLIPPVPRPNSYQYEGIVPLDNRRIVFQCLEAMKNLL